MKPSELLKEKGWVQGEYHTPNGYCLLGALDTCDRLDKYEEIFDEVKGLSKWNDDPSRTKEEVIALLERHGL